MVSRRLLVLRFVRSYIAQWGASPSYSEIAAALGTNKRRVHHAVKRLVAEGLLQQQPGPRGLTLPTAREQAVRVLRELGWQVDEDHETVTKGQLPAGPVLDYDPVHGVSIAHGRKARTKASGKGDEPGRTGTAAGQ